MAKIIGITQCEIWRNVLRRAGSNFVNDNFPGTFADFRLKIFTQEKNISYGDPCLLNLQL